jgi:protein-disulfide isomerase/uncharacterized membrane protein
METTGVQVPLSFRQPRPVVRWLAVLLAAVGWYVSLQLLRVASGARPADPLLQALCGGQADPGQTDDCTSVLTSPQGYVPLGSGPDAPRIPISALGMAYFAAVGLWYLFVGPPTWPGRLWHLLISAFVVGGAWQSVDYIRVMAWELHRWCGGCLIVHAVNGGLLALTLLAYPWRPPTRPQTRHPSTRLALAAAAAGALALITHLALAYVVVAGTILKERTEKYVAVLNDPEYILWDFRRQAPVSIPLLDDEVFAGSPTAPNTVVVFSDFQCPHCREAHQLLAQILDRYPGQLRVVWRHYPQDPECNPDPKYRGGGHASACRASRAIEAARVVGGSEACARMRGLLYARRDQLPTVPWSRQTPQQRRLLEDWAAEIGLDREAFTQATDSPAVAARIRADLELADRLGVHAIPVIYLNGKRLRNWSKVETWDTLLGGLSPPASQPTIPPAAHVDAP